MGSVYAFTNDVNPSWIKVGATDRDIEERLAEANKGAFAIASYTCLHYRVTPNPFEAERIAHELLAPWRVKGEFFEATPEAVKSVLDVAVERAELLDTVYAVRRVTRKEDVGEFVSRVRKENKLTQEELADVAKVGRRFLIELEKGKDTVELGKVFDVLAALKIEMFLRLPHDQKLIPD